jgi:hypothetical protein
VRIWKTQDGKTGNCLAHLHCRTTYCEKLGVYLGISTAFIGTSLDTWNDLIESISTGDEQTVRRGEKNLLYL